MGDYGGGVGAVLGVWWLWQWCGTCGGGVIAVVVVFSLLCVGVILMWCYVPVDVDADICYVLM